MSRRDEPFLRELEDVPKALERALRIAASDDLPSAARLKRIEGHIVAEIIASSARSASDSDVERWREVAVARQREKTGETTSGFRLVAGTPTRISRFKTSIVVLAAFAATWASVAGYRAYREAMEGGTAPTARQPSVIEEPRTVPAPVDPTTAEPQRVAPGPAPIEPATNEPERVGPAEPEHVTPGPRPVESPSTPEPVPAVVDTKAPAPLAPRKTPVLLRNDPWGLSAPPKSAPPIDKRAPAPTNAVEEDLLERATRALATDPQSALSLMEQHRSTFGNGRLAQEREVVVIQALAKLGRLDAAQAVAKRFLAEHPESPYAKDVLTLAGAPRR